VHDSVKKYERFWSFQLDGIKERAERKDNRTIGSRELRERTALTSSERSNSHAGRDPQCRSINHAFVATMRSSNATHCPSGDGTAQPWISPKELHRPST
jgi:hypothetical protein